MLLPKRFSASGMTISSNFSAPSNTPFCIATAKTIIFMFRRTAGFSSATYTLEPVKNGEVGLVNLLTPMVKATPVLSVMTDDLGVLHDGEECGCGIASPYLEIIGRVGLKDIKTCAAGAAELLAGVKL